MTDLRTAAQQALEALESAVEYDYHGTPLTETHAGFDDAATALKAALAEPVQEPVAAWENKYGMKEWEVHALRAGWMPAPPKRKPLTEEEIDELSRTMVKGDRSVNWLCRAIERAYGIGEHR